MIKNLLLTTLLLFFVSISYSQIVNPHLSYTLKEGETMKTISKKIGVKKKYLKSINSTLGNKPGKNTVINIPIDAPELRSLYPSHTVDVKQGLYSIARKYGLTVEELKFANSLSSDDIDIGLELIIPEPKRLKGKEIELPLEELKKEYIVHIVQKGDTIYNISKRYNIDELKLYEINPELDFGLKLGMYLKIRKTSDLGYFENDDTLFFEDNIDLDKPLNIALLLPFNSYKYDSLSPYSIFRRKKTLVDIVSDMYMGMSIALDKLQSQGADIRLSVFDTQNNIDTIRSIIRTNRDVKYDAIIGPLFHKNSKKTSELISKTPIILPMDYKGKSGLYASNLIKLGADKDIYEDTAVDYMIRNYTYETIIIVGDGTIESKIIIDRVKAKLDLSGKVYELIVFYDSQEVDRDYFRECLSVIRDNWIIAAIGDKRKSTMISTLVNSLTVQDEVNMRLFSFEKTRGFDIIDNARLAKLNYTYISSESLNIDNENMSEFYDLYKEKYNSFPSSSSILGYDTFLETIMRLYGEGDYYENLSKGTSTRLAHKYSYKLSKNQGVINQNIFMLQYQPDISVKKIPLYKELENFL